MMNRPDDDLPLPAHSGTWEDSSDAPDEAAISRTPSPGQTPENDEQAASAAMREGGEPLADLTVALRLGFIDFAGHPITGLGYKIVVDGDVLARGDTNSQGLCTPLTGLIPYAPFEILIRQDNGSYTLKHAGQIACGDMDMCGVAPTIKVDLKTEEHKGPPAPPTVKPAPASVAAQPAQAPKPNAPPVGAALAKQAKPSMQTQNCRNEAGHPVASMTDKFQDWAGRHRIPTLGLWTWKDFQPGAKGCTTPQDQPKAKAAAATPAAPTPSRPTSGRDAGPLIVKSLDQKPPQEVEDLMTVMAEHATWKWDTMPSSATILASITNRTFSAPTDLKPSSMPVRRCYKSVKVGLWRAHLVQGVNEDIPATGAGAWLKQQGFKEVTHEVPDGRWAMPGDVIVYKYPDAKEKDLDAKSQEKYKKTLEKYEQEKPKYLAAKQIYAEAKATYDAEKANWTKANPKKPFPKKFDKPAPKPLKAPELENTKYGHIDVRTYDGYLSDFARTHFPDGTKFVPVGIYRKIYDPLPDLRVRAFLMVIASREAKTIFLKEGYAEAYRALPGKGKFQSFSSHPFEGKAPPSSASGAYGILLDTWQRYLPILLISDGSDLFSPLVQDRIAVAIMDSTANALGLIRRGEIEKAAFILSTKNQWTSLPGGKESSGYTPKEMMSDYNTFLNRLLK